MKSIKFLLPFVLFLSSLTLQSCAQNQNQKKKDSQTAVSQQELEGLARATVAGGCFWCVEAIFERVEGVKAAVSGYAGGTEKNPTYEQVSAGRSSHAEAVEIYYDPSIISYEQILEIFFATHDPTTLNRQGPDVGMQYRSAVFYRNQQEKEKIEAHIAALENARKFKDPIVTQVVPLETFYEAEGYHQDYYALNPGNPYIQSVSRPKVEKFEKEYKQFLKK